MPPEVMTRDELMLMDRRKVRDIAVTKAKVDGLMTGDVNQKGNKEGWIDYIIDDIRLPVWRVKPPKSEGDKTPRKSKKTQVPDEVVVVEELSAPVDQEESRDPLSDTISEALSLGNICIMPPRQDGSKRPYASTWTEYQKRRSTAEEVEKWYRNGLTGFGIICGEVSGGLECLDFDVRDIYSEWRQSGEDYGILKLIERLEQGYMEHSPNGVHLLYRCTEISGNIKLATRPKYPEEMKDAEDKVKTLIETRGEGGFIIASPSCGYVHPSGQPYTLISGSLSSIPTITPSERADLYTIARIFHVEQEETVKKERKQAESETRSQGGSTAEDFCERGSWEDALPGWQYIFSKGDTHYMRRPGKERDISATINYMGLNLFHNYSSSTPFKPNKSITKFQAYAITHHGGDGKAAARELYRLGYGERKSGKDTTGEDWREQAEASDAPRKYLFISAVEDLLEEIRIDWLIKGIIEVGSTGQLFGASGKGKSFIALDMGMSLAAGINWHDRKCAKGLVLYFAGEGHRGLRRRIQAYHKHYPDRDISNFHRSRSKITFDDKGISIVIREVRELEEQTGIPVAFIIIDTLARHIQGHENDTKDMGDFIHKVDDLRNTFPSSSAMVVHHTGTAAGDRSRGSNALVGACDFEIKCEAGLLTFTKMKDGAEPEPVEFKLTQVELGFDEDGMAITSCVVQYGERSPENRKQTLTRNEAKGMNALLTASAKLPEEWDGKQGALIGDWRAAFYESIRYDKPDIEKNSMEKAFKRMSESLWEKRAVHQEGYINVPLADNYQEEIRGKQLAARMSS